MNLGFANPSLFALTAAIGVPLLIHLVARTRPKVFHFPSVEFLRRAVRDTMRVRQPREWLVLALRTLLVAALVGAFLQPLLTSEKGLAATGEKKTIVLLIDQSASMGAVENGRTCMAVAIEKANEILEAAGPGTLANVIWIKATPEAVFPEPGPNIAFLREALGKASALPESGAGEAAWRLASAQAEASGGAREIYVLSDFQKSAWENWKTEPPVNTRCFLIPVSSGTVSNTAITAIKLVPAQAAAGEKLEARCTVRNFSPEPLRTTLFLDVGGNRFSRPVDLPPWSETEAVFPTVLPQPGEFPITATLDEDRFHGDDQRFAVIRARDGLRLGIYPAPGEKAAHAWKQAARALGNINVVPLNEPVQKDNAPDYLLVEGWTGEKAAELLAMAEAGTALFIQPGADIPASALATLFATKDARPGGRMETSPEGGWKVAVSAPDAPVFKLFQTGEFGNPFDGRVNRRARIDPAVFSDSGARTLAGYTDGVPALVRRDTNGAPVYLFNLPVNSKDGSWIDQATFVPFLAELWAHSRPIRAGEGTESPAGSPLAFQPPADADVAGIILVDNEGKPVPLAPRVSGGAATLASNNSVPMGRYRWLLDGQPIHTSVVNFPSEESDLRVTNANALSGTTMEAGAAAHMVYERDGRPLWPWLLAAGFLFLLGEGLAMHTLPKPQRA